MMGDRFDIKVAVGDVVKKEQALVNVDIELIKAKGKSLISPVIFVNGESFQLLKCNQNVVQGEEDILKFST